MRRHLPYGITVITQCYLSPDTSELAQPNPSQTDWYLIYLPQTGGWKAELTYVVGYIPRWFTCLQTVTHPSSNWAQCRATALIETNVLTTTPCRHPYNQEGHSVCKTNPISAVLQCYLVVLRDLGDLA